MSNIACRVVFFSDLKNTTNLKVTVPLFLNDMLMMFYYNSLLSLIY